MFSTAIAAAVATSIAVILYVYAISIPIDIAGVTACVKVTVIATAPVTGITTYIDSAAATDTVPSRC